MNETPTRIKQVYLSKIGDDLGINIGQLQWELWDYLHGKIGVHLADSIDVQIKDQLRNQLGDIIWSELYMRYHQ